MIEDFVFICAFLDNNFLKKIPLLNIKNSLILLLERYKILLKNDKFIINENGSINNGNLLILLRSLDNKNVEDELINIEKL